MRKCKTQLKLIIKKKFEGVEAVLREGLTHHCEIHASLEWMVYPTSMPNRVLLR